MSNYERQGTFDMLNDALFAQLDRLTKADKDNVEREIERSKAVSQLATNINNNMGNAVKVANLMAMEGMDVSGIRATMPRMLGGGDGGE